ncbi:MAG: MMPL family transporter [Alphaproteobacteria bacterium]|nr:MMPL family transporter [Alphaproteobacteria bacterium]MCL2505648.1 MMPL family transporter [Alphaproteobacteria bacterium]
MFLSFLAKLVDFSRKHALLILFLSFALASTGSLFIVQKFAITTDINTLFPDDLTWRKHEVALEQAFPNKIDTMVIVVNSDNQSVLEVMASELAEKLASMPYLFTYVSRPDSLDFFKTHGLLFLSQEELEGALAQMSQAQPFIASISADPSLRGFLSSLDLMIKGLQAKAVPTDFLAQPISAISTSLTSSLEGKFLPIDWQQLLPKDNSLDSPQSSLLSNTRYIIAKPVLDFSKLQPASTAISFVKKTISEIEQTHDLTGKVQTRLTGPVVLNDDEFSSVSEGAGLATVLSVVLVFVLLLFGMRTWRIVLPIIYTLLLGLIATTVFALAAVGHFTLISIAFAVLFIGIAVDFGIQFGSRYRDEFSTEPNHALALQKTVNVVAIPLAVAAAATALGFFAFTPTNYKGISELGLIAGAGMIIAFVLNLTLLPALMTLTKPSPEKKAIGIKALAPLNNFLISKPNILISLFIAITMVMAVFASQIKFDFDPLNLKNPKLESVSTMIELLNDENNSSYAAQLLADSASDALVKAIEFEQVPQVSHVVTLDSFIPDNQEQKLEMIADTSMMLSPSFDVTPIEAPSMEQLLDAFRQTGLALREAVSSMDTADAQYNNFRAFSDLLLKIAETSDGKVLALAHRNIVEPLQSKAAEMKQLLEAQVVDLNNLPDEIKRDWMTKDGKWLIEVHPRRDASGSPRDTKLLEDFVQAVTAVDPNISGAPVAIIESGREIIRAFALAALYAVASIGLLALVVFRRVWDVLMTLIPLTVAGILTLATMEFIGLPINFANVIALPILFTLGISYAVYFVFYARQGRVDFLSSSMARAVLFCALTVLAAFISLAVSDHLGTQSMGILLTIALAYCLICTFLILPVLNCFDKRYDDDGEDEEPPHNERPQIFALEEDAEDAETEDDEAVELVDVIDDAEEEKAPPKPLQDEIQDDFSDEPDETGEEDIAQLNFPKNPAPIEEVSLDMEGLTFKEDLSGTAPIREEDYVSDDQFYFDEQKVKTEAPRNPQPLSEFSSFNDGDSLRVAVKESSNKKRNKKKKQSDEDSQPSLPIS